MVLDLLKELIPWGIGLLILFFLWLIFINQQRLHKIRHSGRVSEIIDRRRNVVIFSVVVGVLVIFLFVNIFT